MAKQTSRAARAISTVAMGACALVLATGLAGCALTTPGLSDVAHEQVEAKLSAADLVEEGYLTVAMDTSDAPQVLTDAEGKPSGYYGDLARALSAKLGLKFKLVPGASAKGSVGEGKADIFIGAKASDAGDGFAVSASVLEDGSAIFAKTSDGSRETPTLSADALTGSTIAVQDASASQDALARNDIEATQKTYPNVNKCFDALAAGEVDYVACDATAGAYLARAYKGTVFAGTISAVSSYGIALPDGNAAVRDAVSEAYDEMLQDGVVDAIHKSWYGGMPLSLSDTLLSGVTLGASEPAPASEVAADAGQPDEAPAEGAASDATSAGGAGETYPTEEDYSVPSDTGETYPSDADYAATEDTGTTYPTNEDYSVQ